MPTRARFEDIQRIGPSFIASRNRQVAEARGIRIDIRGMRELRASLRELAPEVDKQLRRDLRAIGRDIAAEARRRAPRRSGALADSLRPSVTKSGVAIRSSLPYANVIHWGGSTGRGHREGVPWSGEVRVSPSLFLSRTLEDNENQIIDELGDAIDRAARAAGWR